MAQTTQIVLTDDLTGETIADGKGDTISFSLDGTSYEIDLTDKNADKFRGEFQDYIAAGRKVSGGRGRTSNASRAGTVSDAKVIRQWAQSQGLDVPSRGRVPAEVRQQYDAAH